MTRPLQRAVGAAALAMLAAYLVLWVQVSPARQRGTDFSASYVAGLLVREGHADRLYDQSAEAARHQAILLPGSHADLPFITPPTTALLSVPLTVFDPETAFRIFSVVQLLLLGASVWVTARAGPWPTRDRPASLVAALAALAGAATVPFLLLGQWDGVCALGLALAYAAMRRERWLAAGVWLALGLGIAKPHLGLGLAAFLLGLGQLRALAGAVVAILGIAAASVLGVGVAASAGFLGAASLALGHTPAPSTMGLLGLTASWLGEGPISWVPALVGGLVGAAAAAALGRQSRHRPERLEPALAGAVAISLLITPHLLAHDLVMLAPAMVWLSGRLAASEPGRWPARRARIVLVAWVALSVLVSFDAGNGAPAPPGRLVPLGLAALAVGCWLLGRGAATAPVAVPG